MKHDLHRIQIILYTFTFSVSVSEEIKNNHDEFHCPYSWHFQDVSNDKVNPTLLYQMSWSISVNISIYVSTQFINKGR